MESSVGYPVYAINCDLGGDRRGLSLGVNISVDNTWFENPHTSKPSGLNIAHKINETYLTVKSAEWQKVRFATKRFSHTVSKAVSRMNFLGLCDSNSKGLESPEFLKITNDWFDIFNSKVSQIDS
ncbi:hypothetical protein ILUMI_26844 [Ignelater luminosus]|uniref:Transposable element P transposase-like GTP-binding insertion domain-containing protein n=1 Tax=Ignelater luminosus TaxID=2038154 RepID=A0A8K0C7B5_IGNLU|nr:hypothetical protein ILUMI_26844 [Ignelater luminosus]